MERYFTKPIAKKMIEKLHMEMEENKNDIANINNKFYVDSVNGSDITGNGSKDKPWKTLTYTLSYLKNKVLSSMKATIYLADGIYTVTSIQSIEYNDNVIIIGNESDQSQVVIESSTVNCCLIRAIYGAKVMVRGVTFRNNSAHTLPTPLTHAIYDSNLILMNCTINSTAASYVYATAAYMNSVVSMRNCKITGTTFYIMFQAVASQINIDNVVISDIKVTHEMGAILVSKNGIIDLGNHVGGPSLSGGKITGKMYTCEQYSHLGLKSSITSTSTIAGTTSTGGVVY